MANYHYWLLVLWYMCLQLIFWGFVSWLPAYLKVARGFTWAEMGWMASLPFLVTVVTKACNGWINDRIGRCAPLMCVSMCLGAICVYSAATVEGKYASVFFLSFAMGFSGMAAPSAWTLLQNLVPANSVGTAGGIMNGIACGIAAASPMIIGLFISLTGSYASGLFCLVGAALLASVTSGILTAHKY